MVSSLLNQNEVHTAVSRLNADNNSIDRNDQNNHPEDSHYEEEPRLLDEDGLYEDIGEDDEEEVENSILKLDLKDKKDKLINLSDLWKKYNDKEYAKESNQEINLGDAIVGATQININSNSNNNHLIKNQLNENSMMNSKYKKKLKKKKSTKFQSSEVMGDQNKNESNCNNTNNLNSKTNKKFPNKKVKNRKETNDMNASNQAQLERIISDERELQDASDIQQQKNEYTYDRCSTSMEGKKNSNKISSNNNHFHNSKNNNYNSSSIDNSNNNNNSRKSKYIFKQKLTNDSNEHYIDREDSLLKVMENDDDNDSVYDSGDEEYEFANKDNSEDLVSLLYFCDIIRVVRMYNIVMF